MPIEKISWRFRNQGNYFKQKKNVARYTFYIFFFLIKSINYKYFKYE